MSPSFSFAALRTSMPTTVDALMSGFWRTLSCALMPAELRLHAHTVINRQMVFIMTFVLVVDLASRVARECGARRLLEMQPADYHANAGPLRRIHEQANSPRITSHDVLTAGRVAVGAASVARNRSRAAAEDRRPVPRTTDPAGSGREAPRAAE